MNKGILFYSLGVLVLIALSGFSNMNGKILAQDASDSNNIDLDFKLLDTTLDTLTMSFEYALVVTENIDTSHLSFTISSANELVFSTAIITLPPLEQGDILRASWVISKVNNNFDLLGNLWYHEGIQSYLASPSNNLFNTADYTGITPLSFAEYANLDEHTFTLCWRSDINLNSCDLGIHETAFTAIPSLNYFYILFAIAGLCILLFGMRRHFMLINRAIG